MEISTCGVRCFKANLFIAALALAVIGPACRRILSKQRHRLNRQKLTPRSCIRQVVPSMAEDAGAARSSFQAR